MAAAFSLVAGEGVTGVSVEAGAAVSATGADSVAAGSGALSATSYPELVFSAKRISGE